MLVIRDITDRTLLHLQEEFLTWASHELRTPLAILQGYLQLAVRRLDADRERTGFTVSYPGYWGSAAASRPGDGAHRRTRLQSGKLQLELTPSIWRRW